MTEGMFGLRNDGRIRKESAYATIRKVMFLDKVTIKVESGRGGNGACTFLQEKFIAHGGPDGGDGGIGGSVYLEASDELSTLLDFKFKSFFKAGDGERGAKKNRTGKSGEDLIIKVPVGTIVRDINEELTIGDLKEIGHRILVAKGGRGGRGNARFKTQRMTVPNFSEPGEAVINRELELELKMIADVGIIGFPNAGKSTLISKMSAAKPKIADYAFTTITPNLGVVKKTFDKMPGLSENPNARPSATDAFVMADIPGLIDGAGDGKGLGYQFLKHIERTKTLIHMVDVWGLMGSNIDMYNEKSHEDPLHNFIQVNFELDKYSQKLSQRKQIIVLNKIEGYPDEDLLKLVERFEEYTGLKLNDRSYLEGTRDPEETFIGLFCLSTLSSEGFKCEKDGSTSRLENGMDHVKSFIEAALDLVPDIEFEVEIDEDYVAEDHDDSDYQIEKIQKNPEQSCWEVHCGKLERLMKITDLTDLDSLQHLFHVTKAIGVIQSIKNRGAKEGDLLNIDGVDFDVTDAVLL